MSTEKNLKEAFAGESQANRKYIAFAKKAESEGYTQIAKLFRAAAEAETVHAMAHLRALKAVKSTQENLAEAIEGETFEFKVMYPGYIEQANKEDHKPALNSFKNAMAVEQVHCSLYIEANSAVKENKDLPKAKIFVCEICGNTVLDEAPDKCPVCGAPKTKFKEIE